MKPIEFFIKSSGVLLLVAALSRFLIAASGAQVLALPDPMLGIPLRYAVLAVGAIELAAALICLLGRRTGIQLGWLAWLGTSYLTFWVGALAMSCQIQGTCLGSLTDPFRLYYGTTGTVLEFLPLAFALAAYLGLAAWWYSLGAARRQRAAQVEASGTMKMSCPACGGHVKFGVQNLGGQVPCPHCQAVLTLRKPDDRLKMLCVLCGGPVEFPAHALGQKIECPHCAKRITLLNPAPTAP